MDRLRMRLTMAVVVIVGAAGCGGGSRSESPGAAEEQVPQAQAQVPALPRNPLGRGVTEEQMEEWMSTLSNWGRWGKDDELGTLNLITPAKRQQALAQAKAGITVSLAHDLMTEKDPAGKTNTRPFVLNMEGLGQDRLDLKFHDFAVTHLDGLCHGSHNGKLYNGWVQKEVSTIEGGCSKLGSQHFKDGIVTRGILIDVPRLKGLPYLEPGTRVYREDVEAFEKKTGIKIGPGDALILRTGRWALRAKGMLDTPMAPDVRRSGWDGSFLPFMKERDIALMGSDDSTNEAQEHFGSDFLSIPVHRFGIVALGMPIIDSADLEALGETAAKLNRWEFLLTVGPIRVPNGTGSPVNPIAVF